MGSDSPRNGNAPEPTAGRYGKTKAEPGHHRRYSIQDIADELGISKTTVSRAISGKGRVSQATRKLVLDFVEEHNYRPNAAAISLAKKRTYSIGLILPGNGEAAQSPFFQLCMLGICETAEKHNYDVMLVFEHGPSYDSIRRILDNRKTDGMLAARSEVGSPVIGLLKKTGMPFVLIGATDDPEVIHVDNNNRAACRDLVSLLISRGARKLALLCGDRRQQVTVSRYAGFEDACRANGLAMEDQQIFSAADDHNRVSDCVGRAIESDADCLICMDDMICSAAMNHLKEKRIKVPDEIKVACFYDSQLLGSMVPSVTGLRFDATELGRSACRELLRQIEHSNGRSKVLPGYQIMLRDSTEWH